MDYFLEEAADLRKTRAGSAEAPRAPRPPTSLPVVRARQLTRQRESTAGGRSPQSTVRRHVARPRGSRPGRHAPWLPEHQPPGAPSRGEAGAGQGTARTPQVLGTPLGAPRPAAGPPPWSRREPHLGLAYPVGPILPYVRQATLFHARRLLPVNSPVFPEALVRGRDAEQLRGLRELPRAEGGVCPLRCVAAARTQRKKASLSLLEPPPVSSGQGPEKLALGSRPRWPNDPHPPWAGKGERKTRLDLTLDCLRTLPQRVPQLRPVRGPPRGRGHGLALS